MTTKAFRLASILMVAAAIMFYGFSIRTSQTVEAKPQNPFDTGGRDDKPAAEVYKNILQFKTLPAGRIQTIMTNWTKTLGVKCNHCHTPGAWEKEDLPAKQVAREMVQMTGKINNEALKAIKNLKSEKPTVSCYTCHRGQAKPDTTAPAPAAPGN